MTITEKRKQRIGRNQDFLHDLQKLLEQHRVELTVEEFDIPNWGTGTFKMVANFEFDHKRENDFAEDIVLGTFVDKNLND